MKLSDSAFAETRLGSHFVHLGGARVGPYTIRATAPDDHEVDVVLCTTYRFLDEHGHVLPEGKMESATRIDERLEAVLLQDIQEEQGRPKCP